MARLPDGDPAPAGGELPAAARAELAGRPFGVYVHVPFCAHRCGYCDFNTYVAGADARATYVEGARAELRLARGVLGDPPPADTVFFGGGTPTLLEPAQIRTLLDEVRACIGVRPSTEVTVEANPETVDERSLAALREAGVTRLSLGMQSAVPHVLETLERAHDPASAPRAARAARSTGFEHVSLDLIYGTPGERDGDWERSLETALAAGVDHISTYGLMVEPGTRLHARVRRGALRPAADAVYARRYRRADARLGAAGLRWYELANWATGTAAESRHNLGYWRSANWWGAGPGAHSHVGGVRWWNVLRPGTYAQRLAAGRSPAAGRETLTPAQRRMERVLLELRLADGLPLTALGARGRMAAGDQAGAGRLERGRLRDGRAVLTLEGRLYADAVARELA